MLLTIHKFSLLILFIVLGVVYVVFAKYYFEQKEETASVILNTLHNNMSELSYILSKNLKDGSNVRSYRAVLDRATSNNDYIAAIIVMDDNDILTQLSHIKPSSFCV